MLDTTLSSDTRQRKIMLASIIVVVAGIVVAFGFVVYSMMADKQHPPPIEFNSVMWKDESLVKSKHPIRIRMVDDLLSKYNFYGRGREEIINLLGEPTNTESLRGWDLAYWLRFDSPDSYGSQWLVFRLNEQGKVLEYKVVTS